MKATTTFNAFLMADHHATLICKKFDETGDAGLCAVCRRRVRQADKFKARVFSDLYDLDEYRRWEAQEYPHLRPGESVWVK